LNYFQISEIHEGIKIIEFGLFQAHFYDFSYVLHGFIDGLAPGVTALEERAANYVQALFIDLDENWQMQLFHVSANHLIFAGSDLKVIGSLQHESAANNGRSSVA